jgi:hypothetical protein
MRASRLQAQALSRHFDESTGEVYDEGILATIQVILRSEAPSIMKEVTFTEDFVDPIIRTAIIEARRNDLARVGTKSLPEMGADKVAQLAAAAGVSIDGLTYSMMSEQLQARTDVGETVKSMTDDFVKAHSAEEALTRAFVEKLTARLYADAHESEKAKVLRLMGYSAPPSASAASPSSAASASSSAASSSTPVAASSVVVPGRRRVAARTLVDEVQRRQQRKEARDAAIAAEKKETGCMSGGYVMASLSFAQKFEMLLRAGKWGGTKPTSGFKSFRVKNAVPFAKCLRFCFNGDKARMMAAWKLNDFEYGNYNQKCVTKKGVEPSCKLVQLIEEMEKKQMEKQ